MDDFAEATARRARWVQTEGTYQPWSTGEVLAVALVLRDKKRLEAMDYTVQEAAQRVYGGMINPPQDFKAWLNAIRETL